LYCLSLDLRLLITPLVSCGLLLSVLRFTASDYSFGILWPLYCLSFDLLLLITSLVSCGHCIVCPLIYGFWLLLWYLQTFLISRLEEVSSMFFFNFIVVSLYMCNMTNTIWQRPFNNLLRVIWFNIFNIFFAWKEYSGESKWKS
jgi:hypothetical protein